VRNLFSSLIAAATLAATLAVVSTAARSPVLASAPSSCGASAALNAVADALTSGSDANVLRSALASERRLFACGDTRDAIAAELISADAYGDVNRPAERCAALADAGKRSAALGDVARARTIASAGHDCR
jgi:hypothetical protein